MIEGGATRDFGRFYEKNVNAVFRFLRFRIGDTHLAEDLTQLTFEKALRAWARFDPSRATERTWVVAIARNVLVDQQRRVKEVPSESIDAERAFGGNNAQVEPAMALRLREGLQGLSQRDREVLGLRFIEDLTTEEIASLLGLSVANVHQIVSRALRRLRSGMQAGPGP